MKPTIIKKCGNEPNPKNGKEVILTYGTIGDQSVFPEYCLVYEDDNYWMGIKPGMPSDGGSLPGWTWSIVRLTPLDPRCQFAFFFHDGGYGSHLIPRYEMDVILLNVLCIEPRPNLAQRQTVYRTLRVCGGIAYNSKTPEQIAFARQFVTVIEKKKLQMGFMLR